MSEELKPCPFCGGKASGKAWSNPSGEFGPGCTDCGVTAESSATWNARTLPQPAAVEAVEVVGMRIRTDGFGSYIADFAMGVPAAMPGEVREPLMTVAQHNRIMAATVPAGCKVVQVELLERTLTALDECAHLNIHYEAAAELRAILEVKDERG